MAKCIFCDSKIEEWDKEQEGYLIINKSSDGHIHTHGCIEDPLLSGELIEAAAKETGLTERFSEKEKISTIPKEIVFHNRQRIGDIFMFTCAVRDFSKAFPDTRINVISTAAHIWDHNPYIDRTLVPTEKNTIKIGPGKLTNSSNRIDWHFANAFRVSIEDALNIHIPQGESRPDIWLSKEEYNSPRIFKDPYWLIVIGGEKGWGCKMYPFERWQEFVNQNPDITFVQLGAKEDDHPRLQGKNIIDYVGKTQGKDTGVRDLFKLFLHAEGSIGLVSFHMHLSGALKKPCIVVAGGREPVSFTRYAGHQYLANDGCLPCSITACWHCDISRCKSIIQDDSKKEVLDRKIPKCVDMIRPEDLTRALNQYYIGGRLTKGKPSPLMKFSNVVDEPPVITAPKAVTASEVIKGDLSFGGGSLTSGDWEYIQSILKEHHVKTVLEFGAGLSTLLLNDLGLKVITYETDTKWIDKIRTLGRNTDIRLWDGKTLNGEVYDGAKEIDFAFVDGPAGGSNRELATKIASQMAKLIIVHDAGREYERKWQDLYIKENFEGPFKGGNRCHFWVRKDLSTKPENILEIAASSDHCETFSNPTPGKLIKIVSTARGWGGCSRSVTTVMKFLLKKGYTVEFIPFRNKVTSREYISFLKQYPEIIVTENYSTIKEECDSLFVYADDYIWEFIKPEIAEIFSNLNASKRIMMLNYRRGKVGELEWTRGWDKYMFLNSTQEKELLKVIPGVKTKVLPPCTELEEFLKVSPCYDNYLKIVRHSSQGDTKFPKDTRDHIVSALESRKEISITMLPGPSFVNEMHGDTYGFWKEPRTDSPEVIAEFLSKGNLFWYSLPAGYMDMGPRVGVEALAAGLPVLADNWGGMVDRVTPECGWLCDSKQEQLDIIKNVTSEELSRKGRAAKERALSEFIPERWVEEII